MARAKDRGFTFVELVGVQALISVIAAAAIPGVLLARQAANESSAIGALKLTTSAQVAYSVACGNGGYAATFVVLGTPPPNHGGEPFVPDYLGAVVAPQYNGYNFTLGAGAAAKAGPSDCNSTSTITTYFAAAVPMINGTTGTRSFAVNQRNTVWQLAGGAAPREPFGPPATPIQ